jgi:tetratricopeptide (TPR) repeat protein
VVDRSRRWLITCYHVVGENKTVEVFFPVHQQGRLATDRSFYFENRASLQESGRLVSGRVLRTDRDADLALIELETLPAETTELRLSASSPQPGDRGQIVGNRYDSAALWASTLGAVRQVKKLREGYFNSGQHLARGARVVVAQAPINEGDSGGPLVNDRGEVIGVAAAVAWEAHGAGLFIDISEVRRLLGAQASQPPREAPPTDRFGPRQIYREGLRSLALVQSSSPERRDSGWLLDRARRLLLTTCEVVGKDETVEVFFPVYQGGEVVSEAAFYRDQKPLLQRKGTLVTGCVLAIDARRNLALLELTSVPEQALDLRFAATPPSPGDALHALGNPRRMDVHWVYAACSVRQKGTMNLGQTTEGPDPAVLLVQGPLSEGEAGGALLNERGELAAMVTGKAAPQQQISYGLDPAEVRAFLAEARPHWLPDSVADLCRRGVLFTRARQYDRALADFAEALRRGPNYAPAYRDRAGAYYLQKQDDRTLADCERALQLDPSLAGAYCHRAAVWARRGEAARALTDCATALRLDSHLALAWALRGQAHLLQGDSASALTDCDEALWNDRKLPLAYLVRGMALAHKEEHDKAIADFTHALVLDPRLCEAIRRRGDSHWARNEVAAAATDYNEALKADPRDAAAHLGRGRVRLARGEWEGGLADFRQALQLQPDLASAVIADTERQGREMNAKEDAAACCLLYRGILEMVKDANAIGADVFSAIQAGLEQIPADRRDAAARDQLAKLLREVRRLLLDRKRP